MGSNETWKFVAETKSCENHKLETQMKDFYIKKVSASKSNKKKSLLESSER